MSENNTLQPYAIFQSGGHQYKATPGSVVQIQKIAGEVGDSVEFSQVLALGGAEFKAGAPYISGACVKGVIKAQMRQPKVTVFKYKRRKNYKVTRGHKQQMTEVEIQSLS